mmetsp:Transcript_7473/g.19095  ORF Transcript_7473/g.19095 Transcript_7473/m.19095 type:complete len:490 (-) Transcript_7473:196-1665(-)
MALVQPPPAQLPMQRATSSFVLPASARQRAQVYNYSAVLEGGLPTSVYNTHQQSQVLHEVQRLRATPLQQLQVTTLSPADYRATVNAGHGVVLPQGTAPMGAPEMVRTTLVCAAAAQAPVVHAAKESGNIPREFRHTNCNLQWCDVRGETRECRGQDFYEQRSQLKNASARKLNEMSSEVLGSTRHLEPSTSRPSQEIRPVAMEACEGLDSTLDRFRPMARQRADRERAEALAISQSPRSMARGRLAKNLSASCGSHFHAYEKPHPQDSEDKGQTAQAEARRRKERNYSDILGASSPRSPRDRLSRCDVEWTANCSFLNTSVEISARRRQQSPRGQAEDGDVCIYQPQVTPRMRRSAEMSADMSIEERKKMAVERSTWDTRGLMETGAELSRRHRERMSARGSPEGSVEMPVQTAAERKKAELGSGALRTGMHQIAAPERHHSAEGASESMMRARRNTTESVQMRHLKNVRPDSARARRLSNLMSSGIF